MHTDLTTQRRVLMLTYRRYLEADRAWTMALVEARAWFPSSSRPRAWTIGNPDSPMRRLYEQRARAMQQLEVARLKLDVSRQRLAAQHRAAQALRLLPL